MAVEEGLIDAIGNILACGDTIVFIPQGGFTAALSTGTVKGFTKDDKVKVKILTSRFPDALPVCLKEPEAVCKIDMPGEH